MRRTACTAGLRIAGVVCLVIVLFAPGPLHADSAEGMELSTGVRQQLRLLHEAWQSWTRSYYKGDPEAASAAVERLQAITRYLGMSRLPDLSAAAATFAVSSAREGDFDRARWALAHARLLDSKRPENDFAEAAVRRHQGDYGGAVKSTLQGYVNLFRLPVERQIWLQNIVVWLLLVLILSGGVFVALQLALHGTALYDDFAEMLPESLPRPAVDVLVLAFLLWPLFLPSGLFWLALYWSILLWAYGTLSERIVLIALWLILGTAPLLLAIQQRSVKVALAPPARTIENLATGRLYGGLFADLGVLRTLIPESAAVLELVADIHRRFDQWEQARSIYTSLIEDIEQDQVFTAAPLTNLGLFYLRQKDYDTAVAYFERAVESDPTLAEGYFNLSQAYSQQYDFERSNDALDEAKRLDREGVESWLVGEATPEQSGVAVDGGVRRVDEIRSELRAAWSGEPRPFDPVDLWRRHLSLSAALATIVLAVAFYYARRQLLVNSEVSLQRGPRSPWLRALVPGWKSALQGRGMRAMLGILMPAGLVMLLVVRRFGYRTPLGFDPGTWLSTTLCLTALVALFAVRLGWELRRV